MTPADFEAVLIPAVIVFAVLGVLRRAASALVISLGLVALLWVGPELEAVVRSFQ